MRTVLKKFSELSVADLYELLRLRSLIFHVEQNCAYCDLDNKDQNALHLMGYDEKSNLVAYARILPAGISYKEVSIGRVVTAAGYRGKGAGKEIMKASLKIIQELYGNVPVRIGAQCYLDKFYRELGFVPQGDQYLEDNIPHIEMLKKG